MLKKSTGNMYKGVSTWNPVCGECEYKCIYCYMRKHPQGPLKFKPKFFKDNFKDHPYIFVCSGTDLFAPNVPKEQIIQIFNKINSHAGNKFLLQTKNPERFLDFIDYFEKHVTLCTTIETGIVENYEGISAAPTILDRFFAMRKLKKYFPFIKTAITIEPIIYFENTIRFFRELKHAMPDQINIGANSGEHTHLREPSSDKVHQLINLIKKEMPKTKLVLKKNLERVLSE